MKLRNRAPWALPFVVLAGLAGTPARAGDKVEVVPDVAYADGGSDRQKLDLYLPEGKKDFPVLVFFHGGGFKGGDRKAVAAVGNALAAHGVGVASVGYRLFPDAKHPHQAEDVAKAFGWVRKNIAERGGDPGRLFVGGHSAGGTLAALLASDEQFLKGAGASAKDIKGVVLLSGTYRLGDNRADIFGDADARKAASPISHARSGLPPFLLAYAENDNPGAEEQTKAFAESLKQNGVESIVFLAKDRDHRTLASKVDGEDPTSARVLAFIREQSGTAGAQ